MPTILRVVGFQTNPIFFLIQLYNRPKGGILVNNVVEERVVLYTELLPESLRQLYTNH